MQSVCTDDFIHVVLGISLYLKEWLFSSSREEHGTSRRQISTTANYQPSLSQLHAEMSFNKSEPTSVYPSSSVNVVFMITALTVSRLILFSSPVLPRASHGAAKQTQVCPLCENDRWTINPLAEGPLTFIIRVWLGKNAPLDSQGALLQSGLEDTLQLNFSALMLLAASACGQNYTIQKVNMNSKLKLTFHKMHSC